MKSFSITSKKQAINRVTKMVLCLLLVHFRSQALTVTNDTILYTHRSSIDPNFKAVISGHKFSYTTADSWDNESRIYSVNILDLTNFSSSVESIQVPKEISVYQLPSFCLTDSFLLIQDEENLNWFLFKKARSRFDLLRKIPTPKNCSFFEVRAVSNNQFLFTDIYNHHPADSVHNTTLVIYDALQNRFLAEVHPDVPCIALSHLPQNWITVCKNNIALADPCGKKIKLFDLELNETDVIEIPEYKQRKELPENKIPFETSPSVINPKILIEKLIKFVPSFSRTESIHFINDSLILVTIIDPDSTQSKTKCIYNTKSKTFHFKNRESQILYSDHVITPYHLFYNGESIYLSDDNFLPDPQLSIEENEKARNNFYEQNEPEFIIEVFKTDL